MKLYRVALYRRNSKLTTNIIIAESKEEATEMFKKKYACYFDDNYTNRNGLRIDTSVIADDLTKAGVVWGY